VTKSAHGVTLMIAGVALLTAYDAISKHLAQSHPVGQVICLRQAATLLFIVPYIMAATGWRALRVVSWPGQLARGMLFVVNAVLIVLALKLLPLATVITIMFSSPIFIAFFSAPLLAERVAPARWSAVLAGFAGVLIVIRPGAAAFEWALLVALGAAAANALRDIMTRRLARTETSIAILFWSTLLVMAAGALTAPLGWKPITLDAAAWFVGAGLFGAAGHFLMIEAFRLAEAAVVSPMRYSALLWGTVIGFAAWGEVPDAWVLTGSAVIIASGIAMMRAGGAESSPAAPGR